MTTSDCVKGIEELLLVLKDIRTAVQWQCHCSQNCLASVWKATFHLPDLEQQLNMSAVVHKLVNSSRFTKKQSPQSLSPFKKQFCLFQLFLQNQSVCYAPNGIPSTGWKSLALWRPNGSTIVAAQKPQLCTSLLASANEWFQYAPSVWYLQSEFRFCCPIRYPILHKFITESLFEREWRQFLRYVNTCHICVFPHVWKWRTGLVTRDGHLHVFESWMKTQLQLVRQLVDWCR